ncbi:hypothetical protein JCM5350_005241 [Sporobolomyces pararoseus]
MNWQEHRCDRAARKILDISNRLSNSAWIYRPVDRRVLEQAIDDLMDAESDLLILGYTHKSFVVDAISRIIRTLGGSTEPSFQIRIGISQLLLGVVKSLSVSSSPFPILDSHLPPEILHLIYDHLVLDEDVHTRQRTLLALRSTSILWRKIVDARLVLYFDSLSRLKAFDRLWVELEEESESRRCWQPWEEIEIDLSKETPSIFHPYGWGVVVQILKYWSRKQEGRHPGKLVVTLPTGEDRPLVRWVEHFVESISVWDRVTVRIPDLQRTEYVDLGKLLYTGKLGAKEERSYYFGSANEPHLLPVSLTQDDILEQASRSNGGDVPVFTGYTEFVAPWLSFTAPLFLLETVKPPGYLPPSRLRHLELTFQVDPSNPAEAIRHVESFFAAISPRIERLVFRLRLYLPHPSPSAESNFTQCFISSLSSCTRLRHFEVGGFGFSPDFLSRLALLSFDTLVILPLQYVKTYDQYLPLIRSALASRTRKVLHVARIDFADEIYSDSESFEHLEERHQSKEGLSLSGGDYFEERSLWRNIATAARVVWD